MGGLPADVAALVERPFWVRFEGGETTGSTSDDCRSLAERGAPQGTVVVAARQTAGRGRLGRAWDSPHGGAYVSVLLRPPPPPSDLSVLPLVISVGVALGLESLGTRVALKWPNDVLAAEESRPGEAGGKLAGILLESSTGPSGVSWVVAGCGVNVARPHSGERAHAAAAAYVDEAGGGQVGIPAVTAAVLDGIADAYVRWCEDGAAPLVAEYARRSALQARAVTVRDAAGEVVAQGLVTGIDGTGALLVDERGTTTAVHAGEVTLRADGDEGAL